MAIETSGCLRLVAFSMSLEVAQSSLELKNARVRAIPFGIPVEARASMVSFTLPFSADNVFPLPRNAVNSGPFFYCKYEYK
jgi:hypothetical protein